MTISDVYQRYLEHEAVSKATSTLRKQDSMWRNYVKSKFGHRYVNDIEIEELHSFLIDLYHNQGKAYAYTEGFLKFFYLLFGYAYKCAAVEQERYNRMFTIRSTRLTMPPKGRDDDSGGIEVYSQYEVGKLEQLFRGGNFYTAFLIGFYCGLRVSECYALRWTDIDWGASTITVNKQLLYEDGCFCLKPVKTLNSERIVDMPVILHNYLFDALEHQRKQKALLGHGYRATEKVLDKTERGKGAVLVGANFINRKDNGELLTPNTVKYFTRKAHAELGIDFHFHALRSTHATMMANLNTPATELMLRLGHKKYSTTLSFYVAKNALAKERLKHDINLLTTEDKPITFSNGKQMPESLLKEAQAAVLKAIPRKR